MEKFPHHLSLYDRKILRRLQANCRLPITEIGEQVGLSTSACHRHIKQLEEQGFIEGYVAQLDPTKLGYAMHVLVEISLSSQADAVLIRFEEAVKQKPEILECQLMAGDADYILRVAVQDMQDFERLHRNVISHLPGVAKVRSNIVLRHVKNWRGYNI